MKKPNTKNVLMILIAILLVGGAFLVAEYRNKQVELVNNEAVIISTTTYTGFIENTEDWKKILIATDKSASSTLKDLTKNNEVLTPTDILARDFFARYMELKQLGTSKDPESQADLVKNALSNVVLEQPKLYTTNDKILTKADISKEAVKQYGNEIGNIFLKNRTGSRNEAIIARDALQKGDPELLKELDPIISSYQKMLNSFIKVVVPQSLLNAHLNLINSMNSALFIVTQLRKSGADPLSGVQATARYQATVKQMHDSLAAIRKGILDLGITYNTSEGGYIFTK